MPTNPGGAVTRLRVALLLAGLLWLPLAPTVTLAQTAPSGLAVGVAAQIANTGGENALLRETPSYDAAVLNAVPAGTPVDLVEGPITDANGSVWFGVVVGGQPGYLATPFLSPAGGPPPPPESGGSPDVVSPQDEAPAAASSPQDWGAGGAVATADLNLRAGPSYDAAVLLVIPAGSPVAPTGETSGSFLGVAYNGQPGWVDAAYLGPAGAPTPGGAIPAPVPAPAPAPVAETPPLADPSTAPAGQPATATAVVNLRGGPSDADGVLRVLPPGSPVTITGAAANGYVPVWYNGTSGWIAAPYLEVLSAESSVLRENVPPDSALSTQHSALLTTTDAVNLRAEPSVDAPVLGLVPPGTAVQPSAGPEGGYYQVTVDGQTGWVSGAYLQDGQPASQPAGQPPPPAEDPAPEPPALEPPTLASEGAPAAGGGGIIWPVTGGTWYIMQGYNGSSHQNQGELWQYYYSLDLARRDAEAAGATVISPASGTVRWLDPGSGGISIDIGNGHAVALFHVTITGAVEAGTPVLQGQRLGYVSGPGGPGFAGRAHVHFALWETADGGNWSRAAAPFTGPYAISGQAFPDIGGSNQYRGTEFTP